MKSVVDRAETRKERWERETLEPTLRKSPERKGPFTTISGRPIERLYTPEDTEAIDYDQQVANPGEFPYTRGIHPTGYRGKLWTMRQFAGFGSPEETNQRYKDLIAAGGTGLSVAFDLPTLMGRDPDHPLCLGEVGKCGVSIVSLKDMERLFDGIPLDDPKITTSMTINSPASMIFAMYLVVAVQYGVDAGLDVDDFVPRLSFFFNSHSDFFEEIAKYRAARKLWAEAMKNRFGAKNPRSWQLRFHTQTAGVSLTAQQPYNNVVRTALQALAAVLGGTNSLHTNSLDEALALPTRETATIALRTQQIIAHESGVTNVVDPLGGSYFIERLTREMEEGTLKYWETIDRMGGMVGAIERGYPQKEIAEASYLFQQAVERRDKVIVGVNDFVQTDEKPLEILYIDDTTANLQLAKLERL